MQELGSAFKRRSQQVYRLFKRTDFLSLSSLFTDMSDGTPSTLQHTPFNIIERDHKAAAIFGRMQVVDRSEQRWVL